MAEWHEMEANSAAKLLHNSAYWWYYLHPPSRLVISFADPYMFVFQLSVKYSGTSFALNVCTHLMSKFCTLHLFAFCCTISITNLEPD